MYASLYEREREPFEPYPDPVFLWLSDRHREALSVLQYGVLDNLGFVLLTGGAGTGKTLLLKELTGRLEDDVVWALISGLSSDRIDFYNKIGTSFGIEGQFISKVQFLVQFSHFLYRAHDAGKKVVLFVDDCHQLTQGLLEELILLSNIERADAKLIDIFLIGQPVFNEMLAQPKNKSIRQRLGLKTELMPLGSDETVAYIKHRLEKAGFVEDIFTSGAFGLIHQYSMGQPRCINRICRQALRAGSLQGKKILDHKLILECVAHLKLPAPPAVTSVKPVQAEEKKKERVGGQFVLKSVVRKSTVAELIARRRKRRAWLFCVLSFLVCVAMGLYLLNPRQESLIEADREGAAAARETGVVSAPVATVLPVGSVVNKGRDAAADLQAEVLTLDEPQQKEAVAEAIGVEEKQVAEAGRFEGEERAIEKSPGEPGAEGEVQEVLPGEVFPVLPPLERGKIVLGMLPDAVGLTDEAERILTGFVETVLQYSDAKILVKGFVSSKNDTPENTQLSEERAASVQRLLVERGIAKEQIEIRGMGVQDPIATNDTPAGRLKNRRVEIEVIDDGV